MGTTSSVRASFSVDREWFFPADPQRLWAVLVRTDQFRSWWTWLRRFDVPGLERGALARCAVAAPGVPFGLRFDVLVREVVPAARVVADVRGDLRGPAVLELHPDGCGSRVRLRWSLDVRLPGVGRAARALRPLAERGQEWVLDAGARQFRRRALGPQSKSNISDRNDFLRRER